ncbi:hypothetical protein, partial [Legionella norrlandica]|uniref:hypothetical protein n=1 Tax=Legionella norrlandica TaxID=1498499 RepID=UPI001F4CA29B
MHKNPFPVHAHEDNKSKWLTHNLRQEKQATSLAPRPIDMDIKNFLFCFIKAMLLDSFFYLNY